MLSKRSMEAARKGAVLMCKKVIVERGISQISLADSMKTNNTYVSDVLNFRRGVSPNFVEQFSKAAELSDDQRKRLIALGARASGWDVTEAEA